MYQIGLIERYNLLVMRQYLHLPVKWIVEVLDSHEVLYFLNFKRILLLY